MKVLKNFMIKSCCYCLGDLKKTPQGFICLSCKKKYRTEKGILIMKSFEGNKKDSLLQKDLQFSQKYVFFVKNLKFNKRIRNEFYKQEEEFCDREAGLSLAGRLVDKKALETFVKLSKLDFSGLNILNIGCGGGKEALWLFKKGAGQIVCLDVSLSFLKLAKTRLKGKKASFVQARAERLPFKDNSFDLVFYMGTLHHLKDIALGLKEAVRVGRKVAILSEPTSKKPVAKILSSLHWNTEYDGLTTKRIDQQEVGKIFQDLGLKVKTKTNFIWFPFPMVSKLSFLNLKNNKLFLSLYFKFLALLDMLFPFLGHNLTVYAYKDKDFNSD